MVVLMSTEGGTDGSFVCYQCPCTAAEVADAHD